MTREEKAKAYDEALERAKKLLLGNEHDKTICTYFEHVFPELKESEGETIRKALLDFFRRKSEKGFEWVEYGIPNSAILSWLKEQKEEKGQNEGQKIVEYPAKCAHEVAVSDDERANEDERIRKEMIYWLKGFIGEEEGYGYTEGEIRERIAYLEKQKEPMPIPDKFSGLKSLLLQYLQSAANRKDDAEIESDTDLWGRKILDYVWKYEDEKERVADGSKTSAGWSEEDEHQIEVAITFLKDYADKGYENAVCCIDWLKSLRPSCKPSEEQMIAFQNSVEHVPHAYYEDMRKLYEQLKKLM